MVGEQGLESIHSDLTAEIKTFALVMGETGLYAKERANRDVGCGWDKDGEEPWIAGEELVASILRTESTTA